MTSRIGSLVDEVLPTVIEARRTIHAHPEPSGEEFLTTRLLADLLRRGGIEPRLRTPKTGLIVDLGSGGKMVAFRADLDALPITEPPSDLSSKVAGMMHACGHDAHAAIALGASLILSRIELPGRARIIFQPAEETFPGGAFELCREGAVEGVDAIFAFHADPSLAAGSIGFRPGAITASADRFYITLEGPGGHTARPHKTVDLVYAAAKVVTELTALLDRRLDARAPLVLVFGKIQAGTADNVIPTIAHLSGTVRVADPEVRSQVAPLLERLVHQIVEPLGASPLVHFQRGIPPVINHPGIVDRLHRTALRVLGPDRATPTHLSMGAEDFARYLAETPGALLRLGCQAPGTATDLHSAGFVLDESCLEVGVRMAVEGILELLGE